MNVNLRIYFFSAAFAASSIEGAEKCSCVFPYKPEACVKSCPALAIMSANKSELAMVLGFSNKDAAKIVEKRSEILARSCGPGIDLDLAKPEDKKLMDAAVEAIGKHSYEAFVERVEKADLARNGRGEFVLNGLTNQRAKEIGKLLSAKSPCESAKSKMMP